MKLAMPGRAARVEGEAKVILHRSRCICVCVVAFCLLLLAGQAAAQKEDWFRTSTGLGVDKPRLAVADFAARYGWYIDAVRRKISMNWLQSTLDPAVPRAHTPKCTMIFVIARDGTVKDIRVAQTSGNYSMDTSAQRALLSSSPMPALPNDYSGSYVNVTFDFDLSMTR